MLNLVAVGERTGSSHAHGLRAGRRASPGLIFHRNYHGDRVKRGCVAALVAWPHPEIQP